MSDRLMETIENVGVCVSKGLGYSALFHRVKIKLSRFYRVFPIPGDMRSMLISPSDYMRKFETVDYK